ncbi:MAG TPA: SH3 domain-containing protein [Anaerolineales bacterium]|nr:SH3 domain-containing protein [Anaerolineales bacterium]
MPTNSSFKLFITALLLVSLACGGTVPSVPTTDPNAAQTAIVETIAAIQIQDTASALPLIGASPTSAPTDTPTLTPTIEFTTTPEKPMISVAVDTFCRIGPGKEYEKVGILLVGETTEIVGRHATGKYWYVRNPDVGAEFCWMSGEYAMLTGNYAMLLVQTPPFARPADFEITYLGMGKCSNDFWSDIRLKSISDQLFESVSLTVRDLDTTTFRSATANDFTFVDGCGGAQEPADYLIQGGTVRISTPTFPFNLNSHNMSISITLCTDSDLRGQCVTKSISYIP